MRPQNRLVRVVETVAASLGIVAAASLTLFTTVAPSGTGRIRFRTRSPRRSNGRPGMNSGGHADAVRTYQASAAWPYDDLERVTAALRGQLPIMALADDVRPDWSTLIVEGPTETSGLHGQVRFEWASVRAGGPTTRL